MEPDHLKKIIRLMVEADLSELSIEDKSAKISLKRGTCVAVTSAAPSIPAVPVQVSNVPASTNTPAASSAESANTFIIKSPMVGTFYAAPNPDAKPYVEVGSTVNNDTVVCVLEAMKVMNEICAECSGKIVEVLAKNGSAIEYGQPLFRVQLKA
ncbi:MAG: acetyl-CoA carboxylase biotin carboxyl carrier protein [Opitutales bacterium]|nr:acetyl-CoA carboxylase biotin carboxyl carrier protein [Opitutales bacterium]